eukprot:2623562-Pyramimonas_sp.AAC.1
MSRIAALHLNIAISHSNDDLTHLGIVPCNWEWANPASPVVLRDCGAMAINSMSVVVVMLTISSCLSA